jgi:endonuclease/exonuclease/phosphatase family metal-dependent hydrolase
MKIPKKVILLATIFFSILPALLVHGQDHTPLKIVTFNIHGFQDDWPMRQSMILEELSEIEPDIVGFQEVLETPGLKGADNSAKVLSERLSTVTGQNYNYIFIDTHFAWGMYDEGLAIMTPHLILDWDVQLLPATIFQRKALWARILTPEGIIHFVTTHLDHLAQDEPTREAQVLAVKAFIAEKDVLPHAASVVCGDFNATPEAPSIQHLVQSDSSDIRYIDTWAHANPGSPGYTMPSNAPSRRIDYIFLKEEGPIPELASAQILNQPVAGLYPSDHIGVMATFATNVQIVPIRILSPQPDETVSGIVPVSWSIDGEHGSFTTTLYVSYDGGGSWTELLHTSANIRAYDWDTTPFKDGTRYLFRLVVQGDTDFGLAESSAPFVVNNPGNAAPEISLLAPIGGEQILGEFNITWAAKDADGDSLSIMLETTTNAGRIWLPLADNIANDGAYRWDTTIMPNSENYQMRLTCFDDSTQVDTISAIFSIFNPRTVLSDSIFKHILGSGDGSIMANVFDESALTGNSYRITFDDTSSSIKTYDVFDEDARQFVVEDAVELDGTTEGPAFDGMRLIISDLPDARIDGEKTGWLIGGSTLDITISIPEINLGTEILKGFAYPADYKMTLFDHPVDTSATYWGAPATPKYFRVTKLADNRLRRMNRC